MPDQSPNRRALWLAAILFAACGMAPSPANACRCANAPLLELFDRAEYAFVGTAVARFDSLAGAEVYSSADPIDHTFVVEMSWKGASTDTLVVQSPRDGASCGYGFEPGIRYVVLAQMRQGHPSTGLCSGNAVLGNALSARYLLPKPAPVAPQAVWPTVSRGDLLVLLRDNGNPSRYEAAQLLAEEITPPGRQLLALTPLVFAAPERAAAVLGATGDGPEAIAAVTELGRQLLDSASPTDRAAALEAVGLLAGGETLADAVRRGFADPAEAVRAVARRVLVTRYGDLAPDQAAELVDRFIGSIEHANEETRWVSIHQLRYFPEQKDCILRYLATVADSGAEPQVKRTAREVIKALSEPAAGR